MSEENQTGSQRRAFYRIDDYVRLAYRMLDLDKPALQPENLLLFARRSHAQKLQLVGEQEQQLRSAIDYLSDKQQNVAQALALLREQVMTIRHDIDDMINESDLDDLVKVSLSGGGIAFGAPEALQVGDRLLLELTLMPKKRYIPAVGEVVTVEENIDQALQMPYRVAVKFTTISVPDQDDIVQHVLEAQRTAIAQHYV